MKEERYIAAIEISSSKIIGSIGRFTSAGQLDVIAVDQEKAVESVRYGIIRNLEDTAMRISRVIDNLQRKPSVKPRKITGLFVGLSGRSMRSISADVEISLPDDTEINDEILQRLHEQARRAAIDSSLEVIEAIPRNFRVGNIETQSPKGVLGNRISAIYDLIVCRPELKRNIERTIQEKLGLKIEGFIVTSMAASNLVLSSDERRLGCMLVDLGAETTSVNIFKHNNLLYFATLPMGSRNITRDLTSLNILEERAEEIKVTSGNAIHSSMTSTLNLSGVKMSDISNLVVSRAEEIAANILEQPIYAGLQYSDLTGGIVCIGGGFKLNNMIELLNEVVPARRGQLPAFVHVEDTRVPSSDMVQVVGILYAAATKTDKECLESPQIKELPETGVPNETGSEKPKIEESPEVPKKQSIFQGLKDRFINMFNADEDDDEIG